MVEKILIVDDEPEALKLFGYSLHRQGYEVVVAQNGQEALDAIEKQAPDLVILDVMMPAMDGYEVCRRIRANPETKNIPIIMLTAKSDTGDKLTGFEAGADDYIGKPVTLAELFARVKALLARSKSVVVTGAGPLKTKTIAFLGVKGGVGTTTLATNVAIALTRQNLSVVLVELRLWGGTIAEMLKVPYQGHLEQLLALDVKALSPQIVQNALVTHFTGLSVLPAPGVNPDMQTLSGIDPAKAEAILRGIQGRCDYLILDLGCGLTPQTIRTLHHCSRTILISEHCPLSLHQTTHTLAALSSLGIIGNRFDVVVNNRSRTNNTMSMAEMESMIGQPLLATIMPMTELLFRVYLEGEGRPIILLQPDNPSVQAITDLAQMLVRD